MLLLVVAIEGCAERANSWTPRADISQSPALTNVPQDALRSRSFSSPRPKRHYRSPAKSNDEARKAVPASPSTSDSDRTAPATAQPAPTVTLADEQSDKDLVAKLLKQVDDKLAELNRAKLHDLDLLSYYHAKGFAESAHKALGEGDYTAAASLAEKASALANSLPDNNGAIR